MESHNNELKVFCEMKLFWKNLKSKSTYKPTRRKSGKDKSKTECKLDCIDSWLKEWVVCEVLQVLKFPPFVLRVRFVEAGMEFNVKKA